MGVMAESMVKYAQPLIAETDGSSDQMQSALAIAQMGLRNDERCHSAW